MQKVNLNSVDFLSNDFYLMLKQKVVFFVREQNKNVIVFRLEIVAFVGESLSLRCTVANSYRQVRFYIILLTFRHLSKTTNNCILPD